MPRARLAPIQAAAPTDPPAAFDLTGTLTIEAAAPEAGDDPNRARPFTMLAYGGGLVRVNGYYLPMVVDLDGLDLGPAEGPVLFGHQRDLDSCLGVSTRRYVEAGQLHAEGRIITAGSARARQVVALAKEKFPWRASIGAQPTRVEEVEPGQTATVNGREFTGPFYIAREASLQEISVLPVPADQDTETAIAASRKEPHTMDPKLRAYIEAAGLDPEKLEPAQLEAWKAAHAAHLAQQARQPEPAGDQQTPGQAAPIAAAAPATGAPTGQQLPAVDLAAMRDTAAREVERQGRLAEICAAAPEIHAQALREGWNAERAELEILRTRRPTSTPAPGTGYAPIAAEALVCALVMQAQTPDAELQRMFPERTLDAARPLERIGLREFLAEAIRAGGGHPPRFNSDGASLIEAAASMASLSNILESALNKVLLSGYRSVDVQARKVCKRARTADFKQVNFYRLLGTGKFEKVNTAGELAHGVLTDSKYTAQADTYGQYLEIGRKQVQNDDMGALLDLPRMLGRQGGVAIDDAFGTLIGANTGSFFHADNNNLLTGAATAFGADALSAAVVKMKKQKTGPATEDAGDKSPASITPWGLLVPTELEIPAETMLGSEYLTIEGSTAKTKSAPRNPHFGKYQVVGMPHLSDSSYTGYSLTAWYLLADPQDVPAFGLVFLNGIETPTVNRVTPRGNVLAIAYQAYIDFGLGFIDPLGAVKSAGV